jgi:probable HAF family extracellular repeat protein
LDEFPDRLLGTLGGSTATATSINDAGQVVGFSLMTNNSGTRAFLYSGGKMTDIGSLGGPGYGSSASGINNAGQVVGQSEVKGTNGTLPQEHAFLFINGQMTDLNSLLPANSGWILDNASAINNKGQIVGSMHKAGGPETPFLLTPTTQAPEPSSLVLLGLGGLGLAGYASRRRNPAGSP